MKYDFLFTCSFENYDEAVKFLDIAVEEYNNRYHSAIFGLTPSEALHGAIPDKHLFASQIQQTRKERILKNKSQLCRQCAPANENQSINPPDESARDGAGR